MAETGSTSNKSKYEEIGAVILIVLIIICIGAPLAIYIILEKSYGSVVASQMFRALLYIVLLGTISIAMISMLFDVVRSEKQQKDSFTLLIAVSCVLIILVVFFTQAIPILKYVGLASAKVVVNITNATLYIQPAKGSELNITLTFTLYNSNPFPINVTRVYVDIGDVCTDIAFIFLFPIPYSKRCYTELDLPSSSIVIEPNSSVTIVAQRIYSKAVSVKDYAPMMIRIHRADILPPPAARIEQQATALAKVMSSSE